MKNQGIPWLKVVFDNAEEILATVLLVITLLAIALQITARSAFNAPLVWPEMLAQFLFLWASVLGTVGAIKRFELIRIDSLLLWAPRPVRAVLEWIGWVSICALLVVLGFKGWQLAMRTTTLATPLPITWAWGYAAAPTFSICALLRLCQMKFFDYRFMLVESFLPDPPAVVLTTDQEQGDNA